MLDVGGGTGIDAMALTAAGFRVVVAEPSPGMAAVARARGAEVMEVAAEGLAAYHGLGAFDAALSNFGALNCLGRLEAFGEGLALRLGPGAPAVLVVMGPFALAESVLLAGTGRFRSLARRRASEVRLGAGSVQVRWWTPGDLARALPAFTLESVHALGVLQPAPDLHAGSRALRRWDARVAGLPLLRGMGDHTICVMRRRP